MNCINCKHFNIFFGSRSGCCAFDEPAVVCSRDVFKRIEGAECYSEWRGAIVEDCAEHEPIVKPVVALRFGYCVDCGEPALEGHHEC